MADATGRPARALGVALALLGLSVAHTWPLASAPQVLSRNDNGDCQLNEWILAWIAHQLPRDPWHLYDANIFFPEPRTLAFSEPLLVPALLGAPLAWLGASPVLAYNLLLLAGFWLTALAGFWVAWRFTGDAIAGLLGASLLAFNPQSLTRLPHLQAQWAVAFPLALLALEELLRAPRRGASLGLGLAVASLALTSGYWGALVAVALGAALLARADAVARRWRTLLPGLAGAGLLALLVSVPPLLPYWHAHQEQQLTRSLEETAAFASAPGNYLATPARLHYAAWSERFFGARGGAYFPGVTALLLSALALAHGGLRDGRRRMLLALAAAGFVLSLGPRTPAYLALHQLFPPMQGLRDPSRFGYLVLLAVALLAPLGWTALRGRLAAARGSALGLALLVAVNAEAWVAPIGYVPFEGFSPVYRRVAEEPRAVLAEFPFYGPADVYRNAEYVLASTVHWRPLVNGYSGFTPPAFVSRAERLRDFPEAQADAELRRLGVTHVVVHLARYREARAARVALALAQDASLELLLTGPSGERLYRLRPETP